MFEGWAIRDLANYRRRCSDNLVTCLGLYLEVGPSGPSSIWIGCPEVMPSTSSECQQSRALPKWLSRVLSRNLNGLVLHNFTQSLNLGPMLWKEYCTAFSSHDDCNFCLRIKARCCLSYRLILQDKIEEAKEKVLSFLYLFNCRKLHLSQVCRDRGSLIGLIHTSPRNQ